MASGLPLAAVASTWASPAARSSRVMTGMNSTVACMSLKNGSDTTGICEGSFRSKTISAVRFPSSGAK